MDKRFWAIVVVIVLVFVGVVAIKGNKKTTTGSSAGVTSHTIGSGSTGVKLVEYGDYECPVCEGYTSTISQVLAKYSDKITFQFSNLPLSSIHPNAIAAARAAEAADLQGKFWAMHDLLYQNSNWSQWSTSSSPTPYFTQYAQQLGLNITKFNTDFQSDTANNRINADIAAFQKTGQQEATPTFFLDGKYVANSSFLDSSTQTPSLTAFSKILDAEIAKKTTK